MYVRLSTIAMAAVAALAAGAAPAFAQPEAEVPRSVRYVQRPVPLRADVYAGRRTTRPIVVLVHGGAFHRGAPRELARRARSLRAQGFAVVVPEYRLACRRSTRRRRCAGHGPAAIGDIHSAIRFARTRVARRTGARVAVVGYSAGGYLAQMAAVTGRRLSRPDVAVSWSGPTALASLRRTRQKAAARRFAGCSKDQCPKRWRRLHPGAHITRCAAPVLMVSARRDSISIAPMRALATGLRRAGVPSQVKTVPGSAHGRELAALAEAATIRFVEGHMTRKRPVDCPPPAPWK